MRVISPFPVVRVFFFLFLSFSLENHLKKQFVEFLIVEVEQTNRLLGAKRNRNSICFLVQSSAKEEERKKKGVTGWKYSSVGIEAEGNRIIIIPSNSG